MFHALQAFETFVFRCPRDITQFTPDILKVAVEYLKHDPNYTYDDDEDMDNTSQMDTDGGFVLLESLIHSSYISVILIICVGNLFVYLSTKAFTCWQDCRWFSLPKIVLGAFWGSI